MTPVAVLDSGLLDRKHILADSIAAVRAPDLPALHLIHGRGHRACFEAIRGKVTTSYPLAVHSLVNDADWRDDFRFRYGQSPEKSLKFQ